MKTYENYSKVIKCSESHCSILLCWGMGANRCVLDTWVWTSYNLIASPMELLVFHPTKYPNLENKIFRLQQGSKVEHGQTARLDRQQLYEILGQQCVCVWAYVLEVYRPPWWGANFDGFPLQWLQVAQKYLGTVVSISSSNHRYHSVGIPH